MSNNWQNILLGLAVMLLLLAVLVSGRFPFPFSNNGFVRANDTGYTEAGVQQAVEANNQFAFDLYRQLESKEKGNLFFSPWSISAASAMLYEGAKGQTAREIQRVFGFLSAERKRRSSFAHIHNVLNQNKDYQLSTANALWAQEDYSFLEEYLTTLKQFYAAKATNLDFKSETEESRRTINDWVEGRTNNKIKGLLPPGSVDSLTRLVLTNAVYFKGDWVEEFDKELTEQEEFQTPEGKLQVPMMRQGEEKDFNYTETEKAKVLELPYRGKELAMLVLLPRENYTLQDLSLTAARWEQLQRELKGQQVKVYLPKFKLETKYELGKHLKEMGVSSAFSSRQADLSGMDGTRKLFVSSVIHQAFVEVNEKGTEAAAATGIPVATSGIPQYKVFRADHPFLFLITDKRTDSILFFGKLVDPAA